MTSVQSNRKDEHVFLAEKQFQETASAGFDQVRLLHNPLPELAVDEVTVQPEVFGRHWQWPFFINAMTGGSPQTGRWNRDLATVAAALDLPMASGSQSVALREPALAETFSVIREVNPDGFVFANLGAGHSIEDVRTAVNMLDANAIQLHINSVQELIMPEGDRAFRWLDHLGDLIAQSPVPVVIKEVGFGMTERAVDQLRSIGAQSVDVGGHGGTNFATIENARRKTGDYGYLADFGQTTVESLLEAQHSALTVIATGGVRTPLDIVRALRLGASAVGVAGLILHWVIQEGVETTIEHLTAWQEQLPVLFAMVGAHDITALAQVPVVLGPELENYRTQRALGKP